MRYQEIVENLQKFTHQNIKQADIARACGLTRGTINNRKKNNVEFLYDEVKKIEQFFGVLFEDIDTNYISSNPQNKSIIEKIGNNQKKVSQIKQNVDTLGKPKGCTGDCRTCNNARILAQQVEIEYMEELPESEKLPEITSLHTDLELITNHWHRQPENLRIIPMQGDNLSTYFYPCKNRDVLIVDIGSKVATREGIYVYSARNNTMLFVGKLNQLMDGTIRIEKFEANGEVIEKLVSLEKQKDVDFKILGRVVKNASLKL